MADTGGHLNNHVDITNYKELISCDSKVNILTYFRNGASAPGINMDKMKYHYNTGNNQLNYVYDTVPAGNYSVDIDAQSINNYQYDAIGNLIKDNAEGISSITWNVYGKISSITKSSGTITYAYDASGNRISKTVGGISTLYVRDASGNVMSVYEIPAANTIIQKELHIYGSGRLGMVTGELEYVDVSLSPEFGQGKIVSFIRGKKYFELSNHLGNVQAVVSDKRISVTGGVYEADIVTATDYAPFGMGLVGRSYSSEEYKYGFNGKENDNETGTQDYGMRIYNPGLGKFLSVDPLTKKFPELTSYQFASNIPIAGIDIDGLEFVLTIYDPQAANSFYLAVDTWKDIYMARKIAFSALNKEMTRQEQEKLLRSQSFNSNNTIDLSADFKKATLEYDKNAPQGLTVHLNLAQGTDYSMIWKKSLYYERGNEKGLEDKAYPIDVRVINSPEFTDYYKDWDFIGKYLNDNVYVSSSNASRGTIQGFLKGAGFVQYNVESLAVNLTGLKSGWSASRSGGEIFGKAQIEDFDESTLSGWGSQLSGGFSLLIGVEKGIWGSFRNLEDAKTFDPQKATFLGEFTGMNVGIRSRFKRNPKPSKGSTASPEITNSTLIKPQ